METCGSHPRRRGPRRHRDRCDRGVHTGSRQGHLAKRGRTGRRQRLVRLVAEPGKPPDPVRRLRATDRPPGVQGQPERHAGVHRRDRRDDARVPAAPRPDRRPLRPEAVRPRDPSPAADAGRRQLVEVGVLRDDLGRLDPLQPRPGVQPRHPADPPAQPDDGRAARARRDSQPPRRAERGPAERELRRLATLRPVSEVRHLPLRPRERLGDGAPHDAGQGRLQPVGQRVRHRLLRAERPRLREVGPAREAAARRRRAGDRVTSGGTRHRRHVRASRDHGPSGGRAHDADLLRRAPLQVARGGTSTASTTPSRCRRRPSARRSRPRRTPRRGGPCAGSRVACSGSRSKAPRGRGSPGRARGGR